jgi:hypothetical protein
MEPRLHYVSFLTETSRTNPVQNVIDFETGYPKFKFLTGDSPCVSIWMSSVSTLYSSQEAMSQELTFGHWVRQHRKELGVTQDEDGKEYQC